MATVLVFLSANGNNKREVYHSPSTARVRAQELVFIGRQAHVTQWGIELMEVSAEQPEPTYKGARLLHVEADTDADQRVKQAVADRVARVRRGLGRNGYQSWREAGAPSLRLDDDSSFQPGPDGTVIVSK